MLIRGDARHLPLRDGCVQCCITSPPYFGLRNYGSANQIGLEQSPDAYVGAVVDVFREVRRVLSDEGTCWLNLGDSYARQAGDDSTKDVDSGLERTGRTGKASILFKSGCNRPPSGLKPKDLLGIPWRVAFALQADGWYLRSDIIWSKPNPMPESVTDRPTKAHEYLFLLAKSERYYYDADAIKEPLATEPHSPGNTQSARWQEIRGASVEKGMSGHLQEPGRIWASGGKRNRRSVWSVATMPYAGAHFATMPEQLVEPCILAGCPLGGLVLDPFCGTGTVLAVASRLGRRGVGVDLSYQDLAAERTAQRGLMFAASE